MDDLLVTSSARLPTSLCGVVKIAMAVSALGLASVTSCEVQADQVAHKPNEAARVAVSDSNTSSTLAANTAHVEIKGLAWINQQPGGNYTLQLMAAASPKPMLALMHKKSLASPLAMAAFKRDGKVLHLLLQGSYTSLDEAETAAAQLEQVTGERPWVRKFSSLPELYDSNSSPQQNHKPAKLPATPVTGAAWLWSRNPVRHTIQLRGGRQAEPLQTALNRHRPKGPIAIIRVRHQGGPWYLLLIGDYASEEEAVEAIKALPPELSKDGAWPRGFASLQDQLVLGNH